MEHFFNPTNANDVIEALELFEAYDVVQLMRTDLHGYTHVMKTNTWCKNWHVLDNDAWEIDEERAARMLVNAESMFYYLDNDHLFMEYLRDDSLMHLAYEEFHSRVENGTLYGVTYFEELIPYYNPIQPVVTQFPADSEFEFTDENSKSIREKMAEYRRRKASSPKKSKKSAIAWQD